MKKININKRRKLFMKKNVLTKGILVLLVITLLAIGFTGCGTVIPTTGTVYMIVTGGWWYDLEMDYMVQFWGVPPGTYALNNVSIGNHFFEATDTGGWWWGYDGFYQYITSGINYVYLYP
jgi:hypothetical protein